MQAMVNTCYQNFFVLLKKMRRELGEKPISPSLEFLTLTMGI